MGDGDRTSRLTVGYPKGLYFFDDKAQVVCPQWATTVPRILAISKGWLK